MGRCLKHMPHNSRMHLLERARHDQIPLLAMGVGRSDASDGRVFPYVFTAPTTHRSQNTAQIRFIGQRTGGMDKLKGLKIAHIYRDDGYGREPLPILDAQDAQYGFTVQHLAVKPPGLDQQVTWLRVKVAQPDWVILRTTGVMTTTALKEAAQVGFPRDKIVGASPTCTEQEFEQALDIASRQAAKSLELRAAMSLSRLWQQQDKRKEAHDLLAPIYGWFTEGFDTADLQEAKALLDALS